MKKKILIALLVVAMVGVSVMAFAGCDSRVKVGFQAGTFGQYYTEDFENLKPTQYQSAGLAVQDMLNGRIKYVITDIAPAKALAANEQYADKIKVIDIPLTDEDYGFIVSKTEKGLLYLAQLNEFLGNNKAKLAALQEAYINGTNEEKLFESGDSKAANALVVATNAEFAPFEYMVGNKYAGYDMEVMAMFCEEYNYTLVIKNMDFDAVVMSVDGVTADVGAAALTYSEERAKSVDFTSTYYSSTQVIICLIDDTTFDDCKTAEDVEKILAQL